MNNFGIYVHIPFCEKKCKYCSFVSSVCDEKTKTAYFLALQNEIQSVKISKKITSIYFGGGTPSCARENLICDTLNLIFKQFSVQKNAEITIECNPNSVSLEKLLAYKKAGFNRISFGAQSFDDNALQKLGRVHKSQQIFDAINLAKKAGFENISIDLILGAEKFFNLENNITKCKNLGVKHISAYMLMLENGTQLKREVEKNLSSILTDDESVLEYEKAVKIFKKLGFNRYEISNFALNGYESKHNINYWQCGQYQGFGISAHSYVNGKRFANTSEFLEYFKCDFVKIFPQVSNEILTKNQKIEEYIMLGLRTKFGIRFDHLLKLGCDLRQEKSAEIEKLLKIKAIKLTKNGIKVSQKFYGVINQIILSLI